MDEKEFTKKEKEFLLQVARKSIDYYLKNGKIMDLQPGELVSEKLMKDGACFVSLHVKENHELRGCIGTLEAHIPLVLDVINNAVGSAFEDPRFYPLRREELDGIKISISILTEPKKVEIKDGEDLLKKLVPNKHGLLVKKGWARATFLPVVWEQLTKKEEFLEHLCMKAGLGKNEWKEPGMEFFFYEAIEFEE